MRSVFAVSILLMSGSVASASGGLSCENVGGPVAIEINAGVTRGMGSPIFSFKGRVDWKSKDVAADLRKMAFEREHVAQYWLDGDDLRLRLYRERAADKEHGYIELEILAKAMPTDESAYGGSYTLTAWDGAGSGEPKQKTVKGRIGCSVE